MSLQSLVGTHRIALERPTQSKDASGGPVKTWNVITTDIACTIQPISTKEKMMFAQHQVYVSHRLFTTLDLKAQPGDRIRNLDSQQLYIVTGYKDQGGRGRVFSIELNEQTGPRA